MPEYPNPGIESFSAESASPQDVLVKQEYTDQINPAAAAIEAAPAAETQEKSTAYSEDVKKVVEGLLQYPEKFRRGIEELRQDSERMRDRKERLAANIAEFEAKLADLLDESRSRREQLASYQGPAVNDNDYIEKANYLASMVNTQEWLSAKIEETQDLIKQNKDEFDSLPDFETKSVEDVDRRSNTKSKTPRDGYWNSGESGDSEETAAAA